MAGKFIFMCFIVVFALIQPFNTLPAAEHKSADVIYRNSKGECYTSDGVILTDPCPLFFRPNAQEPKKEHVVIVEPTVTYSRQAEYSSTQASPSTSTFRASPLENHANFRPYDSRTDSATTVAYYPYYLRGSSGAQSDSRDRVIVDTGSDAAQQRFVSRTGSTARDDRDQIMYYYSDGRTQSSQVQPPPQPSGQTWYYYSDGRKQSSQASSQSSSQSSSQAPPPSQLTYSGGSAVQFYFPNGTVIKTRRGEENKHIMDIYPNQYVIEVNELTTTTPRPIIDCPPYPHPCNGVVYQQTTQCCKCYFVPTTSRCCPCIYPNLPNQNK